MKSSELDLSGVFFVFLVFSDGILRSEANSRIYLQGIHTDCRTCTCFNLKLILKTKFDLKFMEKILHFSGRKAFKVRVCNDRFAYLSA